MKHFNFIKGLFLALLIVCAAQVKAESYTVTEALSAFVAGETKPAVVTGYIVGSIDDKSISDANFSGTAVLKTNLLIADNADETDITKCLAVQLPSGTVRDALNLVDNPGNYKQLVTLTGSLEKYFGVAGLKSVNEYSFGGDAPEQPETPETPETGKTLFAETFTTSLGAFTTQETAGNFAWKFEEYNGKGYAKVSGYANSASQEAESWLISPTINFAGVNAAYIAFDYVINKGDASLAATNHKVVVTDNYTGDVATTTWVEVPFGAYNDNTWGFKSTGNIALPEAIMNKEAVVVAFKYNSTTANSSTWEMNNLVIAAVAGETPETPEPEEPETPACEYINETFASDFGVFSTEETVGSYPWVIDYSTAKATSYVDGTNNAATSWLISTPVDFTNETEAYVAFEYIIRYAESGKVAENHQLLISADYAGDAAEATWVDLPYNAVEGSNWNTFYKANVAVPAEFLGKNGVVFALRYTATTKAGTWEVKNFKVAHGKVEASEPETPEEVAEYTVAEAIAAFTGTAKPAVVKGYIVGTINGQVYTEGCVFSGTAESKTNLLIADNPDETDYNNCMPVQLPTGKVRDALNLVDNPGNYKQLVTLTGSLEKYFGVAGLKNVKEYSFDGDVPEQPEQPEEPETPVTPETPEITIGENILLNSGFEEWNDGALTAWGKDGSNASAHNATIAQSTDSNTGSYAVEVNGYADANKRLASKAYILPAGTYTLSAFIKQSGETVGAFRLGYAVIKDGAIANSDYIYLNDATNVTDEWEYYDVEFTLEETATIAVVVMNSKKGKGASILVDDVKLVALSTTAIEIVTEDCNAAPLYYDLSGRVVKNPANGIYICNGKKVIVK